LILVSYGGKNCPTGAISRESLTKSLPTDRSADRGDRSGRLSLVIIKMLLS